MKIGIVSDSHDHIPNAQKAVKMLNGLGVELVIHCGDIVAPFMLPIFKQLACKLVAVFGNNEGEVHKLTEMAEPEKFELSSFAELNLDGRKIAVYHGTVPQITDALLNCGRYDAVFTGHTHTPVNEKHGKTLHLNPGALGFLGVGRPDNPTLAVYDTKTNTAEHLEVK